MKILDELVETNDILNVLRAFPELDKLSQSQKASWLFGLVRIWNCIYNCAIINQIFRRKDLIKVLVFCFNRPGVASFDVQTFSARSGE